MKKRRLLAAALVCASILLCGCEEKAENTSTDNTSSSTEDVLFHTDGQRYDNLYDGEGRVIESVCFENGTIAFSTIFQYAEDGTYIKHYDKEHKLVSVNFCTPDKGTVYTDIFGDDNQHRYVYSNGVVIEKINYKNGMPSIGTHYDENGAQIKSVTYDSNGEIAIYKLFSYNDAGKNSRIDTYNGNDVLTGSICYEYTEKGYYSSVITLDGQGLVVGCTEYVYDENGKQKAERVYKYENGVAVSYEEWVTDTDGKKILAGSYDV